MADTTTTGNNAVNRADSMELLTTQERIPERVRRLEQTITGGLAGSGGGGGAPTGPAGGDLTGTYPNPQIAAGTIIDSDVAVANKDGAAGTPSMRTLGTGAQQAASGADTRLSDPRPPSGAASGDLSGSYPSPQIAAGAIMDADVNAVAAIAESKLALASDAAAATPSRRSLGTGPFQAAAGNDARLNDQRIPTGAAGGDLSSTYPSPTIAPRILYGIRANQILSGGGVITVAASRLKWGTRFIAISGGRGAATAPSGYFDISMPPVGTVITGVGGASNDTVTIDGIALSAWIALYYIPPLGGSTATVNANFRLVLYTADVTIPPEWILVAYVNSDAPQHVIVPPGVPIPTTGGTYTMGSGTSGAAGGDLSGTYPNPQIAAGAIVDADINAAAAIALSKLATNPLARANHTGTQIAATISDFDTQVRTSRLDQMAIPTAPVSLNSQKITSLATPTVPADAASKGYVDALIGPEVSVGAAEPSPRTSQLLWLDMDEPEVPIMAGTPPLVTALPTTGLLDGMEIYYQNAAMATDGIIWHLRYNAGSASTYKWEWIGGTPIVSSLLAAVTCTSAVYGDTTGTPGPDWTSVLPGEYRLELRVTAQQNLVPGYLFAGVSIGVAGPAEDMVGNRFASVNAPVSGASIPFLKAIPAATLVRARYRVTSDGGTATLTNRGLIVTPVRVG
jgi:hypothetical protein